MGKNIQLSFHKIIAESRYVRSNYNFSVYHDVPIRCIYVVYYLFLSA